jgi:ribose transport system permease protein
MTAASKSISITARRGLDWDILWERFGIATVLLVTWLVSYFWVPNFSNPDNFLNVIRQGSFVGVAAVGMTIAIISGVFDLSIGSALALAAWVAVWTAARAGVGAGFIAALSVGLIIGGINGFLVSRVQIPAFIATLGMLFIVAGVTLIISNGEPVRYNAPNFIWWGNESIGFLPVPFVVFILSALIGAGLLHYTSFGRYVFAKGSNSTAAMVAGVPLEQITFVVFLVVGIFTAVSAFLIGSRLYSANPGLESGFELRVIATVVLGGTRLAGGRGSMLGSVAAALLFATLANILNLVHADPFVQKIVEGLVLLIALSIEGIRQRIAERLSRRMD